MSSQAFIDALVREDFCAFMHRVFQTVSPGDTFRSSWHHQAIAWQLERIEFGRNRRLVINVPPRSLKTITASIAWPAWLLGHDPTLKIVCISYSADLALKFARDCRRVMQTDWFQRAFPGCRLSRRTAEHDFETTRGGGRFSTSVDGTLTGRGGHIVIIDDPLKVSDAQSEPARRKVNDFYTQTAISRLNDPNTGAMLLVMQRLHEDDLAGRLIEEEKWHHLCLPARADERRRIAIGPKTYHIMRRGEFLEPVRSGRDYLLIQERRMGSPSFSAQYLQKPVPAIGQLIRREWLRFQESMPDKSMGGTLVQSWDTANKAGVFSDYSACVTALVQHNRVYVLDVYRERLDFPQLRTAVIRLANHWRADVLLIEDRASGEQLLRTLWHDRPRGVPTPIARPATTDKESRVAGQSHRVEAGDLILPKDAPWLGLFMHELLAFPMGRYDDQVDALTHLLGWSSSRPVFDEIVGPELIDIEDSKYSYDPYYDSVQATIDAWAPNEYLD